MKSLAIHMLKKQSTTNIVIFMIDDALNLDFLQVLLQEHKSLHKLMENAAELTVFIRKKNSGYSYPIFPL